MFQRSSANSNLATRGNAVQSYQTLPCVQCSSGLWPSLLCSNFPCRSGFSKFLNPSYTFQCASGHSNAAKSFNAAHDSCILLHVSVQFRTLEVCYTLYSLGVLFGPLNFLYVAMQSRTLEPLMLFRRRRSSSGLFNFAIRFHEVQDFGIFLHVLMQFWAIELWYTLRCSSGLLNFDSWTLLAVSRKFWIRESCCTFQCSSGLSNFAIRLDGVQDFWTSTSLLVQFMTCEPSCMLQCRSGHSNSAISFDAVQNLRTLPHVSMQFGTLELCHTFRCSSGLQNFAKILDASG